MVVKVGTSTLTHENGTTNIKRMSELASVISDVMNSGVEMALVTSGAIGVGVGKLHLPKRPEDTPGRQAAATVGQCELMFMYDKFFKEYGKTIGQLLITRSDVEDIERCKNLRNAFETLLSYGALPVVNENDAVAVEEIVFGDNDSLSAIVARLIGADALVILSDIDGLYNGDPHLEGSRLIPVVEEITPEIEGFARGAGTSRGTGGMVTKLHAADIATSAGVDVYIINGKNAAGIYDILDGRPNGTLFRRKKK